MVFTDLTDRMERAARNGTKAHIDAESVRALIASPAWAHILDLKTKELVAQWHATLPGQQPGTTTPAASSSGRSGSITGPSASSGSSAGMTREEPGEAVEHAERRRALAAVAQIGRPRRQKTR